MSGPIGPGVRVSDCGAWNANPKPEYYAQKIPTSSSDASWAEIWVGSGAGCRLTGSCPAR